MKIFLRKVPIILILSTFSPLALSAQWIDTTVNVGGQPIALAYNPTNNKVYCANFTSNYITIKYENGNLHH